MKGNSEDQDPRKKVSIVGRKSKVTLKDLANLPDDFLWFSNLDRMIPRILRGKDIEDLSRVHSFQVR